MAERFSPPSSGGPLGSALGGQASAHLLQMLQNSCTPNLIGLSCSSGRSVKILEKRTRGPNSGVMIIWLRPYSPMPALMA